MNSGPTTEKERYLILDALRGLGLAGIALANYPEFALWTFLSTAGQERHRALLRNRIWTGHPFRTDTCGNHGAVRFPVADSREPVVAETLPFRAAGVDMAHAHLRPLFPSGKREISPARGTLRGERPLLYAVTTKTFSASFVQQTPLTGCEVVGRRHIRGVGHVPPELAEELTQILFLEHIAAAGIRQVAG